MKNVLFISNVKFSYYGSNGKTYLSFFNGLDGFRVSQLYFNKSTDDSFDEGRDYLLSDVEVIKTSLSINSQNGSGSKEFSPLGKENGFIVSTSRIFSSLKVILRDFLFLNYRLFSNNSFNCWLANQKPDIIFLAGADYLFNYYYADQIATRLDIPMVVFFGDDYFIYNKGKGIGRVYHKYFLRRVLPIIARSREIFVINEIMQEKYNIYFGRQTKILVQSSMILNKIEPKSIDISKNVVFSYIGMIHSGRLETLLWFVQFLRDFNRKYSCSTQLKIYTPSELNIDDYCQLMDVLLIEKMLTTDSDFISALTNTDFLVHVEGFSKKYISKVALSFSTKIVDYLQSNRCIVAIGPSSVASLDFFGRYNLAHIIGDNMNLNSHMNSLFELISNNVVYSGYCERSSKHYKENFRKDLVKEMLRSTLCGAISSQKNL